MSHTFDYAVLEVEEVPNENITDFNFNILDK